MIFLVLQAVQGKDALVVRKIWLTLTVPSTVSKTGDVSLVWIKATFPEDGKEGFLL